MYRDNNTFNTKAKAIQTTGLNNNTQAKNALEQFKGDVAQKFSAAATAFGDFATALNTKATKCGGPAKLKKHAEQILKAATQFQGEAKVFQQLADIFKAKVTAFKAAFSDSGAADQKVWNLKDAVGIFQDAAERFHDVAKSLAENLKGTELEEEAIAFKDAAVEFTIEAKLFYALALKVDKPEGLKENGIPAAFQDATEAFANAAALFGYKQEGQVKQGNDDSAAANNNQNSFNQVALTLGNGLKKKTGTTLKVINFGNATSGVAKDFNDAGTAFNPINFTDATECGSGTDNLNDKAQTAKSVSTSETFATEKAEFDTVVTTSIQILRIFYYYSI